MKITSYIALSLVLLFITSSTLVAGELAYIEGVDDRAEASFAKTNGNTDTMTVSGKLKTTRYFNEYRVSASGAVLRTESSGVETEDKLKFDLWVERDITDSLFALGAFSYFRDTFAGYNFRIFLGPGVGYTFIDSDARLLQGTTLLLYNYDDYSAGAQDTDENISFKLSGKYSQHLTETLSFKQLLDYTVSLEDASKSFIDSESRLEAKVNDTFSLGLSFILNYQNNPPSSAIDKTDTTIFTSVIADF